MLSIIYWSLFVSLVINLVMFLIAFRLKSDKLTDISYGVTFIALALLAFFASDKTGYAVIGTLLVCVWAVRIGGFLLYRVLKVGRDRRFDGVRENFWRFGQFWLGQALAAWVLMVPIILAITRNNTWHAVALIGVVLWLVGLALESVADFQKFRFSRRQENENKWIDSGVWRYSRHPNYFGEILVWFGIYVYALPGLSPAEGVVAIISPLFITALLLFVSGVPILERNADEKWGNDPAYWAYKKRTSLIIPLPKK